MRKVKFMLMALVAAIVMSCGTTRTVPITGRKQNILVSDEQVLSPILLWLSVLVSVLPLL